MKEVWKDVEGFEGRYEISNFGRVRSRISMRNGRKVLKEYFHVLKHSISRGYHRVCLIDDMGGRNMRSVHRLVATAFIGDCTDLEINHKDGDKSNNQVSNLEICDQSYNTIHAYKHGLMKPCNNGLWKSIVLLKDNKVINTFKSIRMMCREYNFDRRGVQRTIKGSRLSYKGYQFRLV